MLTRLTELNLLRCGLTNRQAEEVSSLTALKSLNLGNSLEVTCSGLEAILRGCRSITRCACTLGNWSFLSILVCAS